MRFVVAACIRAYQLFLSPLRTLLPLGGVNGCRFHPSCSHYALEAVQTHGAWRGLALALRRLARCHPWHDGGFDPVPRLQTSTAGDCCSQHRRKF